MAEKAATLKIKLTVACSSSFHFKNQTLELAFLHSRMHYSRYYLRWVFTVQPWLAWNSWRSACLCCPSSGINCMYHYTWEHDVLFCKLLYILLFVRNGFGEEPRTPLSSYMLEYKFQGNLMFQI